MKLGKLINFIIEIIGGTLLLMIVLLTFSRIVFRQFFNFNIVWSDEVSQFCMSWLALLGSICLTKDNQHLNTGLKLHKKFKEWQVCLIDSILDLVIISITAVVAYQSVKFSYMAMDTVSLSLPWVKMGYIFIALPVFMSAVCYYYLKSFFKNLTSILKKIKAVFTGA
jgi:TRAP-type C4-dicarboxylate transport system permease small subunit